MSKKKYSHDDSHNNLPISKMTFEDALAELESIVQRLEQGLSHLDTSITTYERGENLKTHCEHLLARAQGQVEKITLTASAKKTDNSNSANVDEAVEGEEELVARSSSATIRGDGGKEELIYDSASPAKPSVEPSADLVGRD